MLTHPESAFFEAKKDREIAFSVLFLSVIFSISSKDMTFYDTPAYAMSKGTNVPYYHQP